MMSRSLPGTKISPNPRSEKGRSQSARGEEFNLGTFSTIGSWKSSKGTSTFHPATDRRRGDRTHLFMRGGIRGAGRYLHHYTLPALQETDHVNVTRNMAAEAADA